ncbi:MAG TPA: tetratricopeptide repeat protein [Humisphaera sp.]
MVPVLCPHCRHDLSTRYGAMFCPRCGQRAAGPAVPANAVPPAGVGGLGEAQADARNLHLFLTTGGSPRAWLGDRWPSKLRVWQSAAQAADPSGLWLAGLCRRFGIGVHPDGRIAVDLLHRAADAGFVPAMTSLGSVYTRGDGVPADPAVARAWYIRAAEAGDALAQRVLTTQSPAPFATFAGQRRA